MENKKVAVSIQIEQVLKEQLTELAECEKRSRSNMITQLLTAGVSERQT